jgi:hypothetical protein
LPLQKGKVGLHLSIGKIYSVEDIEKAKNSPSFEREYNLKYLGRIGNVFNTREIELAIEKGENYDPNRYNEMSPKSMGIDPEFGSSAFGIVVTQWQDQQIRLYMLRNIKDQTLTKCYRQYTNCTSGVIL